MNPTSATDAELLRLLESAFDAHRAAEALLVELAAEVAHRSNQPEGLADRLGCTSAAALFAQIGRMSQATASRWIRLAAQVRPRLMLSGEVVEPFYPEVGAAFATGTIGADAAGVIVAALAATSRRADPDDLAAAEAALVEFAREHPADSVKRLAAMWRDALDPDGLEPAELVERRSLRRSMLASGLKRYVLELDPEGAAFLDAAIDASVGTSLRLPRFEDDSDSAPLRDSSLSTAQLGADAIVELARHGNSCVNTAIPLPSATVVVRISLEALQSGLGRAEIDGTESTLSAAAVRRLAADAHIIPVVLGGGSAVLDWGMSRRLFTRTQRLALAERDGGCAFGDCRRPPSYTQAHHVRWWASGRGPTNLSNGILLCSKHHHAVHDYGWQIEVRDNVPWFIPPSSVDVLRRPRRGGRLPSPASVLLPHG